MIRYFFWLVFFFPLLMTAQGIESYSPQQDSYVGGNKKFYKDFHEVLFKRKLEPCADKNESYYFRVVVYPDASIKYVKEEDTVKIAQNKCAFDLSRNVGKYLKGFNPATINGEKVTAMTAFWIFPDDLFENYKEGYDALDLMTNATFKGGLNEFRKEVAGNVDLSRFNASQPFKLVVSFVVNAEGRLEEVNLIESTPNAEFNRMVLSAVKSVRRKWTPAYVRGVPVKSRFRLPLVFNFGQD